MEIVVQRHRIIGTDRIVFDAWQCIEDWLPIVNQQHSTKTTIDGIWYGRIGTDSLPPEIYALKAGSNERIAAVKAFFAVCYEVAHLAIQARYPETALGTKDSGKIEIALNLAILAEETRLRVQGVDPNSAAIQIGRTFHIAPEQVFLTLSGVVHA